MNPTPHTPIALTAVLSSSSRPVLRSSTAEGGGNKALTSSQPGLRIALSPPRLAQITKFLSGFLRLTPAALLALAACSTPLPPESQWKTETYQQTAGSAGFGGQVVLDTTTTNATVVSIDAAQRTLLLKYPDGRTTTYTAGPEVKRFNQIKVGDVIKATLADERALSLDKGGPLSNVSATDSTVALPDTGKPGVKKLRILSFTGKVLAIDLIGHQATLQLADGQTRTVRVREAVNLANFSPGDTVSVRITETTTILVETP
jgi:hypothetical protein